MDKTEFPLVEIRQRKEELIGGRIMTGANTQVLIDGKKVPYARSVEFKVDARGLAVVKLELYANVKIHGKIKTEITEIDVKTGEEVENGQKKSN